MKQVAGNSLKRNKNAWAIFSIINNAKINDANVVGWKLVGGNKITVKVSFRIIRKFRNEIIVSGIGPSEKERLVSLANGSKTINFYLPDEMVLFQTSIKQIESSGDIKIEMPVEIAQIDRRKHLRLFLTEGVEAQVKFYKQSHGLKVYTQQFDKECFDISAGGLSFIISKSESRFFREGDGLFAIELSIGDKVVSLNGEITSILELEPNNQNKLHYKGWKVCLKNEIIDENGSEIINNFVFNNLPLDEAI